MDEKSYSENLDEAHGIPSPKLSATAVVQAAGLLTKYTQLSAVIASCMQHRKTGIVMQLSVYDATKSFVTVNSNEILPALMIVLDTCDRGLRACGVDVDAYDEELRGEMTKRFPPLIHQQVADTANQNINPD